LRRRKLSARPCLLSPGDLYLRSRFVELAPRQRRVDQRQHLILAHEISELNIHLAQLPSRLSAEYRRVCDELAAVSVAHHDIATDYRIDADDRRARGALGYGRLVAPQLQPTSKPDRERYDANDGRPP